MSISFLISPREKVMRINKMITKGEMFWYLKKFSKLVGNILTSVSVCTVCGYLGLKG